jgi:hypothetical protein
MASRNATRGRFKTFRIVIRSRAIRDPADLVEIMELAR